MKLFSTVQTYLQAKVLTYALNAQVDALIAQKLLQFIKTKKRPSQKDEISLRTQNFISLAQTHRRPDQAILVIAYSLERFNGLVNFIYARLMQKLLFIKPPLNIKTPKAYQKYKTSFHSLTHTWTKLLVGKLDDISAYAKSHNLSLSLTRRQVKDLSILVQRENIKSNTKTGKDILSPTKANSEKINLIKSAASKSNNPQLFLRSAAKTELSAAKWDRYFVKLLTF